MKIIDILGLVFSIVGTEGVVYANNSRDTNWNFNLGSYQANSYTGFRRKEDASYSYIKVNYKKADVRAWVQATNGREVGSPKTYCGSGKEAFIMNMVNEKGYHQARLVVEAPYKNPQRIPTNGLWSPDSVRADGSPYI